MSIVSRRIVDLQTGLLPLMSFLGESEHARRMGDPAICDFVFGNPHDMPLDAFVDAVREHAIPAHKDWFSYTPKHGPAAEAIAASLRESTRLPFEAADVCLTAGTFGGLAVALRAIVDAGDEVIFLSPPWFFYESMIATAGATPVRVTLHGPTFALDPAAIESAITSRTRAIIVNSPHNPTGRIYRREELDGLSAVLTQASARHGRPIVLLSDESYKRVLFDGREFTSPAEVYDDTVVLYTYAKQLLAPGERLGYLAVSPRISSRDELQRATFLAAILGGWQFPNSVLQRALPDIETLSIDVATIERRRDRLARALTDMGYRVTVPEATFYMIVKSPLADDRAFADRLAGYDVFVGPGYIFELPGYFRLSMTANDAMIDRALPGFAAALAEVRGSSSKK